MWYGRERAENRSLYDVLVIEGAQRNYIAAATSEALILFDNKVFWLYFHFLLRK